MRIHTAKTANDATTAQFRISGLRMLASHAPGAPDAAWFISVAASTPRTMGLGLRYRAASTRERSCVLSPISASPTTLVETRNDCMGCCIRAARTERDDAHSSDPVGSECVSSVLPNISCARHEESFRLAKCVDVRPRTSRSSRLHPNPKARFYRARCYRIKSPDWKLIAMTNLTRRVCGGPLTACRGCSRGSAVRSRPGVISMLRIDKEVE